MKLTMLLMAVAGALTVTGVQAQEMLKSKGCLACHDVDKKKMGPSLKDIAAKYKDDKAAEATLVAKLKEAKGAVKEVLATK